MNRFVVANPRRCIGCKACEIACALAHLSVDVNAANENELPFIPRLSLVRAARVTMPVQCRQCEDAPCANVCKEGAIVQKDGCNIVYDELCIGCKKCMVVCPFGAIDVKPLIVNDRTVAQHGLQADGAAKEVFVTQKCDLCLGRSEGPACVAICPGDAFVIVDDEMLKETTKNKRFAAAKEIGKL
ncbi:4Fe-4S dicluster domain-containing protein [Azotosporobacter soli]|uniref:4Fe-4S dicluster domain-containing protein n=1 Tax=Azotosporobacter soli TaxID=3055040 RepID=UPI0031FEBA53